MHSCLFLSHSTTMEWLDHLLSSLDNSEESTLSTPSPSPPPLVSTSAWLGLPPFTAIQVASPQPPISTSPQPPSVLSLPGIPGGSPPSTSGTTGSASQSQPRSATPSASSSLFPSPPCFVTPTHSASPLPSLSTITFVSPPRLSSSVSLFNPSPPQLPTRKSPVVLTLRRPPAVGFPKECSCCVHQVCRIIESEIKIRKHACMQNAFFFNLLLSGRDFLRPLLTREARGGIRVSMESLPSLILFG